MDLLFPAYVYTLVKMMKKWTTHKALSNNCNISCNYFNMEPRHTPLLSSTLTKQRTLRKCMDSFLWGADYFRDESDKMIHDFKENYNYAVHIWQYLVDEMRGLWFHRPLLFSSLFPSLKETKSGIVTLIMHHWRLNLWMQSCLAGPAKQTASYWS